jgi:hypothetical protein
MNHKIGEVHDGAATMDWMEQEQETWYHHYLCCCDHLFLAWHESSSSNEAPGEHHRHTRAR